MFYSRFVSGFLFAKIGHFMLFSNKTSQNLFPLPVLVSRKQPPFIARGFSPHRKEPSDVLFLLRRMPSRGYSSSHRLPQCPRCPLLRHWLPLVVSSSLYFAESASTVLGNMVSTSHSGLIYDFFMRIIVYRLVCRPRSPILAHRSRLDGLLGHST